MVKAFSAVLTNIKRYAMPHTERFQLEILYITFERSWFFFYYKLLCSRKA
jgi:hypothetical protein